jgi:AcrR family transcriptional regulator
MQPMEQAGIRERKKRDTHLALSQAARELVQARGLEKVTIEEIAEAADVSVRTFFNYFPCKEAAVVGIDAGALRELADELRQRPDDEDPITALRAVLLSDDGATGMLYRWRLRNDLVGRYPALLPRHLASMVSVEESLAAALADRLGVDPTVDPSPRTLVAAALAAMRAGLAWWEGSARTESLDDVLDRAFGQVVFTSQRKP